MSIDRNRSMLNRVQVTDAFWKAQQEKVIETVIPYQYKILNDEIPGIEKSHAIANFKHAAGLEDGEFYGMVFQDSDVAKWLEGAAYSLAVKPDADLERRVDEVIDLIGKAQRPDGYLNTYFTVKEPEHRWQDLQEGHELYCAGHMMEAAAACYEATGKDKLLGIMERMADCIIEHFTNVNPHGIPGHQEIEIGLMRMYHLTHQEKYLRMAKHFIDERGKNPAYFKEEAEKRSFSLFDISPEDTLYNQTWLPVRQQSEAAGHSVRAVYMYTAMADIAGETEDAELLEACRRLWNNITEKRMYLTGGIGSSGVGEAFTKDYDLPNDMAYGETCAAIGLGFFARKMLELEHSGKYADILERVLYNGILSGMQADGKRFFYVNPLEVNPGISGEVPGYKHVLPQRPEWYACACCPPNVVRMITSLGKYIWAEDESHIYAHLLIGSNVRLEKAEIEMKTEYPWEGKASFSVRSKTHKAFTLAVHIPGYVKEFQLVLNGEQIPDTVELKDGYAYIHRTWGADDLLELQFDMQVRRVYANSQVRQDCGCTALMRGPFVYCFEGVDNGEFLQELNIPRTAEITEASGSGELLKGCILLKMTGIRATSAGTLYSEQPPVKSKAELTAVPYYLWGNRGENQMRVWMHESEGV